MSGFRHYSTTPDLDISDSSFDGSSKAGLVSAEPAASKIPRITNAGIPGAVVKSRGKEGGAEWAGQARGKTSTRGPLGEPEPRNNWQSEGFK